MMNIKTIGPESTENTKQDKYIHMYVCMYVYMAFIFTYTRQNSKDKESILKEAQRRGHLIYG